MVKRSKLLEVLDETHLENRNDDFAFNYPTDNGYSFWAYDEEKNILYQCFIDPKDRNGRWEADYIEDEYL